MRRVVRLSLALVAAALVALLLPSGAVADHGDGPKFRAWFNPRTTITYRGDICTVSARFGMQEMSEHGVEQFKFRMRAYDAKNYLAQDFLAGILQTWGWYYSAKFPDDSRDFYWNTGIDGQFSVAQTASGLLPSAVFRVKAVGIRPSFWQPDYKVWADVGECEPGQVGAYS